MFYNSIGFWFALLSLSLVSTWYFLSIQSSKTDVWYLGVNQTVASLGLTTTYRDWWSSNNPIHDQAGPDKIERTNWVPVASASSHLLLVNNTAATISVILSPPPPARRRGDHHHCLSGLVFYFVFKQNTRAGWLLEIFWSTKFSPLQAHVVTLHINETLFVQINPNYLKDWSLRRISLLGTLQSKDKHKWFALRIQTRTTISRIYNCKS